MTQKRKKLALISLTGCGGCLIDLRRSRQIIEKLEKFCEFFWLDESSQIPEKIDLAIIEGYSSSLREKKCVQEIRKNAELVSCLGACAILGGVDSKINRLDHRIKGDVTITPIKEIIRVDYVVPGCPPNTDEIIKLILDKYWGKHFRLSDLSVCFECKKNENECLLKNGRPCLGPVTRSGCNSICVNSNMSCLGCRGSFEDSNTNRMIEVLEQKNISEERISQLINFYGSRD